MHCQLFGTGMVSSGNLGVESVNEGANGAISECFSYNVQSLRASLLIVL